MGVRHAKLEFGSQKRGDPHGGLQGAGKTTMCGKRGALKKKNYGRAYAHACDFFRPAAFLQLQFVGEISKSPSRTRHAIPVLTRKKRLRSQAQVYRCSHRRYGGRLNRRDMMGS
jgi:hypothetical protein